MNDQQLIEQIRTALTDEVAGLRPPADLLERIRSRRGPHNQLAARLASRAGGALAIVASVAVVVIIALTLASIGDRRPATKGASSVPAGTPLAVRTLVARLAVLRRPQTAADRLPAPVRAQLTSPIIPRLTRLAATFNAGAGPLAAVDIYVVVVTPPAAPVDIVTTVAVAGRAGHRYLLGLPEVVDDQDAVATRGLIGGAVGSAGSSDGTRGVNAGVVPDGVTRVKWIFQSGRGRSVTTVYAKVENNVAVSRAAGLGVYSATWYGSDGRVLASYNQVAHRFAEESSALAASARQPIAAALSKHFAIFRRPVPAPATITHLPRRLAIVIARQGYGLNVAQARFVPYSGSSGLWVIPGAHGVSMMAQLNRLGGVGGGNVPVSLALSGGMITTSCCVSGGTAIRGLVPDGNSAVTVVLGGGAVRHVPVSDNVYSVTVTGKVVSVIAKDAAGHRVTIHAP